ncbi:MAG: hypothetical protein IKU56_04090 [Clostridia bacterium]|nr:hypothetical protein [Clostridia bacterium]
MNERSVAQLQQEAALRVQRMAERSRRLVREHPVNVYRGVTLTPPLSEKVHPIREESPACEEQPACAEACRPEKPCRLPEQKPREKDWLSFLAGDQERVLLLLLILVLGHNGAPTELLLALLYIAL